MNDILWLSLGSLGLLLIAVSTILGLRWKKKKGKLDEAQLLTLAAVWSIELIFACILAASVAVVVWSDERNLVRLLGIAALGGAVAYIIGSVLISLRLFEWLASGNCGEVFGFLVFGIFVLVYYILVASICRHIILPIVFRIAGISDAQIPPVFGKKKSW